METVDWIPYCIWNIHPSQMFFEICSIRDINYDYVYDVKWEQYYEG